ncbi:alpha/beta-hydrolase [Exidia glandulosa HHB12029]|uniref:Alpha/beta-hydrolase n=1 Tax=Exidia glandulosa HHB12029 TaxID=1314781 RepID=A0A165E2J3_EXIGL|nr:alpha/beta-hydrolase [Exidia glandulosa HHB12029]
MFAVFSILALAFSTFAGTPVPRCVESIAQISASAKNFNLSFPAEGTSWGSGSEGVQESFNSASGLLALGEPTVPVSGTYGIHMRFCEPSSAVERRKDTPQILVHGVSYDDEYWDIGFKPDTYSYVRFAAAQGYATLNIARLGNGKSDRPDPLKIVQSPFEVAVLRSIIATARTGRIPGADQEFGTIVYVGHSFGSMILNGIVASEPTLVDAAIFTGYAHNSIDTSPVSVQPASENDPARFGDLPPEYLTTTNTSTRATDLYGSPGTFDPAALAWDEAHKDTATLGELLTVGFTITAAPKFEGDVLTIIGDQDFPFCPEAGCANVHKEGKFYPKARSVEAAVIPSTGHSLNYHLSAPQFYRTIQAWLTRHDF